jgi:hypothetical protein
VGNVARVHAALAGDLATGHDGARTLAQDSGLFNRADAFVQLFGAWGDSSRSRATGHLAKIVRWNGVKRRRSCAEGLGPPLNQFQSTETRDELFAERAQA